MNTVMEILIRLGIGLMGAAVVIEYIRMDRSNAKWLRDEMAKREKGEDE